MAEGAKEGLFVRSVLSFMQPRKNKVNSNVYEVEILEILEDNEGAKAMAGHLLSSGRSKHIDVRWHFLRDLVESGGAKIMHVAPGWQHDDILTKALLATLFKRHRVALMNLPDGA